MLTPAQFSEIREKIIHYGFKHQHDGRGPSCSACLRTGGATHAGKDQPVCLTIEELLADLKELVDEEPAKQEMVAADQAGAFQFLISYIDQHGLIRSIYVQAAKDEADAVKQGMEQLMNALRLQIPAPVTRGMSLKVANLERGFLSPVGWVRDRDWRHER
jgi:hypothetical protein